jgi:hypothetical protein
MFGYCFTQLTDVFQEKNGIAGFDRVPKFDLELLRAIQARPAAIERAEGQQLGGSPMPASSATSPLGATRPA